MKPELEALLKAYDAFKQTPEGPEATRLFAIYESMIEETSRKCGGSREVLHNAVSRYHPRWVRANLPPGFPTKLGVE
jgi:hypothetical protein